MDSNLDVLKANIRSYPDFPKPGILFRDIFAAMGNPESLSAMLELTKDKARCHFLASP
jgi:adenine phosphoribosyltransferase